MNELEGWEKIKLLGAKTHEELKEIYASSDVFVCPSITAQDGDSEGVPTVIMEAMVSELPVVASNSGGITQLIKDGVSGLLCEEKSVWQLVDNICCLLDDAELYQRIVRNGKKTMEQYDYCAIAEKYVEMIKRIQ